MNSALALFYLASASLFATGRSQFVGGWASREEGSCVSGEVSCGSRGPGFSACCPSGTVCLSPVSIPGYTDTTGCCPTGADCSEDLAYYRVCADSSWSLYNDSGLPFCCTEGYQGGVGSYYDSCRDGAFPSGETALPEVTQGALAAATTSTPVSTPTKTTSPNSPSTTSTPGPNTTSSGQDSTATSTNSSSSKLSTGVIAGIVVGAILGIALIGFLAWWIGRRAGMRRNRGQGGALMAFSADQPREVDNNLPPPSYPRDQSYPLSEHYFKPELPAGPLAASPYRPAVSELAA